MHNEEYEGKAKEAQLILDNPVFKQVFLDIESNIQELWKKTNAKEVEEREKLWLSLKLLHKIEGQIKNHITSYSFKENQAANSEETDNA